MTSSSGSGWHDWGGWELVLVRRGGSPPVTAGKATRPPLPAIRSPTLVLHRTGDQAVPVMESRYMAERIPRAKYVELHGDDHMPSVGDADAILDEVQEFLTGVRPAPEPDRVLATVLFTDIVGSTERPA